MKILLIAARGELESQRSALTRRGYTVLESPPGLALDRASSFGPDLILLDAPGAEIPGLWGAARLRHVPILSVALRGGLSPTHLATLVERVVG